ncbi:P-selectin [Merluccius polli]|uniref:p-selectin n=1 Tax=Merluccius polli TaxID=89951 RepID=A0AA47MNM6_MERPO|nr:P-selectin [Merluccius polli]
MAQHYKTAVSASHFHLIKWPRPWEQARVFCQTYYVDLAALSTEEQYLRLQDDIPTQKASFWLGLKRDNQHSDWKWVSNEELSYDRWYHINKGVRCGSLKAVESKDRRLLGRYCKEHHSSVCQGPVGPQKALLESLGCDHLTATWNVSASMRDVDHAYNITMCGATCDTFLYVYYTGINHTSVSINLYNLTCSSSYVMNITATVTRLDAATGKNTTLQSSTMTMSMTTAPSGVHPGTHTWLILAIFAFLALTVALLLFIFCHRPHTCSGQ